MPVKNSGRKVMSIGRRNQESDMRSSKRVRRTRGVLAGTLIGFGSLSLGIEAAGATSVSHDVAMLGCLSQRMVRPPSYILGCGSGTYVITNLHWTSWDRTNARGTGNYVLNTCTPTCSDDNNVSYHATFVASGLRSTSGGMVYRSLTINYVKGGHRSSVTWALPPF
jgi:hypothetical protein